MKIDEIVALSKAGFTAEQIAAMAAAPTAPTQSPTKTTPAPAPAPAPTTPPATPNPIDLLMQQVANLTSVIQSNALGNTNMPTPEDPEDILAAIINPPTKELKK